MVLKILTNTRQFVHDIDLMRGKFVCGTNPRQQQHLRRPKRPGAKNDLFARINDASLPRMAELNASDPPVRNHQFLDRRFGQDR